MYLELRHVFDLSNLVLNKQKFTLDFISPRLMQLVRVGDRIVDLLPLGCIFVSDLPFEQLFLVFLTWRGSIPFYKMVLEVRKHL